MITFLLRVIFLVVIVALVWWWVVVVPDTERSGESAHDADEPTQLEEVIASSEGGAAVSTAETISPAEDGDVTADERDLTAEIPEQDAEVDTREASLPEKVLHDVPFVGQAPLAQWEDPRFQDACEEASILMASLWVRDQKAPRKKAATEMLESLFAAEKNFFAGDPLDTSAEDTARFALAHLDLAVEYVAGISRDEIVAALAAGKVVIAPTDGKALGNPYFSGGGPDRHMLVIRGYDQGQGVFITNDPGTKRGEKYAYDMDTLYAAIRDYATGYHEPFAATREKNVILIAR